MHCLICGANEIEPRFLLEEMLSRRTYCVNRCRRCGYIFNRSLVTGEIDYKSLYRADYFTVVYEEYFKLVGSGEYKEDDKFPIYCQALDLVEGTIPPGHLLEIGCGLGFFLDYARSRKWEVKGVELSEFAAGEAKRIYGVDVFCGELQETKFEPHGFDVVAIFDVIEHVLSPLEFLEEIVRILKPEGYLLLITDNDTNFITGLTSLLYKITFGMIRYPCSRAYPIFNVSYFTESLLRSLLERFGFEVLYSQKIDQPLSKTKLSGRVERAALRALYAVNRVLNSQYQIFLVCKRVP